MGTLDSEQVLAWIRAARAGDDEALSELIGAAMEFLFPAVLSMIVELHRGGSYLTDALHRGGPDLPERMRDDAWEVTHAACCRMALKLDTFRGRNAFGREVKFSTWLYAVARNELRNLLRSRRREARRRLPPVRADDGAAESPVDHLLNQAAEPFDPGSTAGSPEEAVVAADTRRLVLEALDLAPLTPEQREAVLLHYGLGYRVERIARLSGVQVGTVKKRLFDGLRKLRTYVKERSDAPPKRERRV